MHLEKVYQKFEIPQYSQALLLTNGSKNCSSMAKELNISHDELYGNFVSMIDSRLRIKKVLSDIAKDALNMENLMLIMDDTMINKEYAKEIEGAAYDYDAGLKRGVNGLRLITSIFTDGNMKIPFDATPYYKREIAQDLYKSKAQIGIEIIESLIQEFKFKRILADAHYSTIMMINFLKEVALNFLMKINRTKKVKIGDKEGQLRNILVLKKNQKSLCMKGIFHGCECYFYVIKLENKNTMYLISNDQMDIEEVRKLYRMRWKIETFHRTAKQQLGLSQCQMRASEKQLLHAFMVMLAYTSAELLRAKTGAARIEDVLKWLRQKKLNVSRYLFSRSEENFCYVA